MSVNATLFDQVAIVTGASSGLGRHFALTLAEAGAKVAVAARRVDRLRDVVAEIEAMDRRAISVALDVTDGDSVREVVSCVETELGPIAVLVNNSGVALTKPALETTDSEWDDVVDVNLRGVWLMAREVANHMIVQGRGGSIINIASILGLRVTKQLASYAASKAGVIQLTKALALEWAVSGIRVNAIAPGYFATEINQGYFEGEAGQAMLKRVPQRRLGQPSELDGALLLLASDAGSYMTGSVIVVDGGHSISSI
ncbi:MAG: glucose 1-dehydrogenase [Alphaproteobacteria bacterium]|nr:glucose 1-dehydrogenase [Alphaproteobacteria bacterium]